MLDVPSQLPFSKFISTKAISPAVSPEKLWKVLESGDFKGEEVSVEEATIKKTGSGQTQIGAVESLNVRATGSGNGIPESRNISSTGSAKVIRR